MSRIDPISQSLAAAEAGTAERPMKPSLFERARGMNRLFFALVVIPTLLSIVYFGFLASDVYVSESRFTVRSPNKSNMSPLGMMLGGSGISTASEESEAVTEFLGSRQALSEVNEDGFVSRAWSDENIFWFDRFGLLGASTGEDLFEYYLGKVRTEDSNNAATVTVLTVRSFDPTSARTINQRLLEKSEVLVNELSERARRDAIASAEAELEAARREAQSAQVALAVFRDREGVVDPELQANAGLQMIGKLQDQLISAQTQLLQMETYTPQASQIPFLRTQVRNLQREVDTQTARLSGGRGSLSASSARYQELLVGSQFAEKQLGTALAAYQEALADARRKQAYVERISQPSLPDDPAYPRRLRGILATFALGLLAWGVISMLLVGIREHRD